MAPLPALTTALDLIRAAGVVGLGPVTGLGLDRALGLDLDRILDRALVPAMVRVPITVRVLDLRPARLVLLAQLRPAAIRPSRLSLRQRSLRYFPFPKVEKHFQERSAEPQVPPLRSG